MFISVVFQTTRGCHCFFFYFFFPVKKIYFRKKKPTTFLKLPWGISGRNMHAELIFYHVPLIYDFAQSL